jgi:flavin reductase (DIM6/NTAB) family NADH-FMN oxidoreductase RutF
MSHDVIDPKAFRQVLGNYPTGVTVVTTVDADGTPRGLTANSFTSVSLDPPLLLVCLGKTTASHPVFMASTHFAVNVLAEDQRDTSSLFASKAPDKFEQAAWQCGPAGSPLIDDSLAWFDCSVHQRVDAGDHTILIGEVKAMGQRSARPLGYCQGAYVSFQLAQAAQEAASHQASVAAVIETPEGVLMQILPSGQLTLPSAAHLGEEGDAGQAQGLRGWLQARGVTATLDFLFSVYETPQGACIVYRGRADSVPAEALAQHALKAIPVGQLASLALPDTALQAMLTRYARERAENSHGIYVGTAQQGAVHALAAA